MLQQSPQSPIWITDPTMKSINPFQHKTPSSGNEGSNLKSLLKRFFLSLCLSAFYNGSSILCFLKEKFICTVTKIKEPVIHKDKKSHKISRCQRSFHKHAHFQAELRVNSSNIEEIELLDLRPLTALSFQFNTSRGGGELTGLISTHIYCIVYSQRNWFPYRGISVKTTRI